jgi:DnaJ-class molecular chaperone
VTGPYREQLETMPCPSCNGTGSVLVNVPRGLDKWTCGECFGTGTLPAPPKKDGGA